MPAGKTRKNPNYEADSKAFAEECLQARKKWQAEAAKVISLKLKRAAEFETQLLDQDISPEEVPALKLKLDAAKHTLKLGGLEIERAEVESKGSVSLVITSEHAQKVLNASE